MAAKTKKPQLTYGAPPRADLLPMSERGRRDRVALTRRWVGIAVGALVLVLLATAGAFVLRMNSNTQIADERRETDAILTELATYQDLSTAISSRAKLQQLRAQAMATDLDWSEVYDSLTAKLPDKATIIGLDLRTGGAPVDGDPTAVGLLASTTIESPNPLDHAKIIEGFSSIDGVLGVSMTLLSGPNEDGTYSYTTTVTLDQTVYTGTFTELAKETN